MKKIFCSRTYLALVLLLTPALAQADVYFTDDFSNGSTTNSLSAPGGTPAASFTSYDFASSKNTSDSTIAPGLLSAKLNAGTSSGYWEVQALFAANPVALTAPGDYVDLTIVFTNSAAGLLANSTKSAIWIGLYNSTAGGGTSNPPVAGDLANGGLNTTAGSSYAAGNCQLWAGYATQIRGQGSPIITRPVQDPALGTTSANQDLLGDGVSGGTFGKSGSGGPGGTTLATAPTQTFTLDTTTAYTVELQIMLDPAGSGNLIISNALYGGGSLVMSNVATATTPLLAAGFDGLAFGAFNSGSSANENPQMDVSSISVTGHSTEITTPPSITSEPASVTVANGGSCAFNVVASGFSMTYQWHRNGTNLIDGGNISGATSSTLVVSPASSADVASDYYVTVTGAGNYSTNSDSASLSLGTAKSLTWNGPGNTWDLNTSANWLDSNNVASEFNFGDSVTFNGANNSASTLISLAGHYLSASSVTVEGNIGYEFSGSGSFAGPGSLYLVNDFLQIDNANTYTGGTIISNTAADLYLQNYSGLGTGPVIMAGGLLEIIPAGSGSLGLPGNIVVANDSTIAYNAVNSSYSAVFFGNLSGIVGKTLTVEIDTFNGVSPGAGMDRIRLNGGDTVYDGNLNLGSSTTLWAAYGDSQTYNGVISGSGAFMQKGNTSYLNGANTYTGGTFPAAGSIGLGNDLALGNGPLFLTVDSTTSTTGHGAIFASGGAHTITNSVEYPTATNNLTLIISGTNNLTLSGPFTLNGNDGTSTYSDRTIEVDNTALTAISGVISDGGLGFGLTKAGAGALALDGVNTYTGSTTVSNGVLEGTGVIASPVTVQSNATLSAGTTVIGTLTINNNLTLAGNLLIKVNKSGSPANDAFSVSGTLSDTGTGTVTVTNLGSALAVGDKFVLFNKPVQNGSALTISGGSIAWANNLATDGSISVSSLVIPKPVINSVSVQGGTQFVLSGTNGIANSSYSVLSSTNLATPLTNWTVETSGTFDGSGGFSVTNAITPGTPQKFLLLRVSP